jgi:hypothetical protein
MNQGVALPFSAWLVPPSPSRKSINGGVRFYNFGTFGFKLPKVSKSSAFFFWIFFLDSYGARRLPGGAW